MRDRLRAVGAGVEVLAYGEWVRAKAYERELEASNAAAAAVILAAELAKRTRSTAQISEVHAGTYCGAPLRAGRRVSSGLSWVFAGRSGVGRTAALPPGSPPRKRTRAEYGCVVM